MYKVGHNKGNRRLLVQRTEINSYVVFASLKVIRGLEYVSYQVMDSSIIFNGLF